MVEAGLEHHIQEAETEILPELKESLSREEWLALGDQIAEAEEAGLPVPQPPKRRSTRRTKSRAMSNSRK